MPEAHTLLTVVQGTVSGIPANKAACLAGAWPTPACTTFPMKTSSTIDGSSDILLSAAFMAAAPNLVAGTSDRLPKKLPMGVLTAETITTSFIFVLFMAKCFPMILIHWLYAKVNNFSEISLLFVKERSNVCMSVSVQAL
jgi:hypothetical protein